MFAATGPWCRAAESEAPFEVPEGFRVIHYADDGLAHDIYSMTLDRSGRVVVAGPGYIKRLRDTDGDGRADRAETLSDIPRAGAHGMHFEPGGALVCVGDKKVMRLRDPDGDGRYGKDAQVLARMEQKASTGGHASHSITKGPDGRYYLMCGNEAGVSERHVTAPGSPIRHPQRGAIVRISPDGRSSRVIADGFRNPYDLAFDRHGTIFTYDSDGERVHGLPYYTPTRVFDVMRGWHHGWVQPGWRRAWSRPAYFFDNAPRLAELGRGSPTGLEVYRHRQFPPRYRGGMFAACWTFGRIYFLPLRRDGSGYRTQPELFLRSTGNAGFAPTALAVGPGGDLLVAIGGRGTRGSVYRIRHRSGPAPQRTELDPLERALRADQPLSAWSRARWQPVADRLGPGAFREAAADPQRPPEQRMRALAILTDRFNGVTAKLARRVADSAGPAVTARAARAVAHSGPVQREAQQWLAELTRHNEPWVRRAAWEALQRAERVDPDLSPAPDWAGAAASSDRRLRTLMVAAARRGGRASFKRQTDARGPAASWRLRLARRWALGARPEGRDAAARQAALARDALRAAGSPELQLEAVRLMQLAIGGIFHEGDDGRIEVGYTADAPKRVPEAERARMAEALLAVMPSGDDRLDREAARLLGMLHAESTDAVTAVANRLNNSRAQSEDIHYLLALCQLPAPRPDAVTRRCADALATLHRKLDRAGMQPARHWPGRVGRMFDALCRRDAALAEALVENPSFGHPKHTLFARRMGPELQRRATRALVRAAAASESDRHWTAELVRLVAKLPAREALPLLRRRHKEAGLRGPVAAALARFGRPDDFERIADGLGAANASVVQRCAAALRDMERAPDPARIGAAIRALERHRRNPEARAALVRLLQHWTDRSAGAEADWRSWFRREHPEAAERIAAGGPADLDAWRKRIRSIDFSRGDAQRGQAIYRSRGCAACHRGGDRMGPSLQGVTRRMSRLDLFTHIVAPDLAISPLYEAVRITTREGDSYIGAVVFDSPASTLLQTGPNTTVRIPGRQQKSRHPVDRSPMPSGLLTGLTDQQLADLYAYLRSLK